MLAYLNMSFYWGTEQSGLFGCVASHAEQEALGAHPNATIESWIKTEGWGDTAIRYNLIKLMSLVTDGSASGTA